MTAVNSEKFVGLLSRFRNIPLAATLCLLLVADFWMVFEAEPRGDAVTGAVLGLTFAKVVLLAVWTALGPAKTLNRVITGCCGIALVALVIAACVSRTAGDSEVWMLGVIVVVQWIVIQVPLLVFRLRFAWRLCWPGEQVAEPTRRDTQFGIGQLMVWMAVVGMTLGIGRLLFPGEMDRSTAAPVEMLTIFGMLTVYACLLAWPVVWSTLAPRWWPFWILGSVLCCGALTWIEVFSFEAILGPGGEASIFWIMNALQAGAAGLALFAVRLAGFRLVRLSH